MSVVKSGENCFHPPDRRDKGQKNNKNVVFSQNTNSLCDLVSVVDDRLQDVRQSLDLLPQVLHVGCLVGDQVPEIKNTYRGYLNCFWHEIEFQIVRA